MNVYEAITTRRSVREYQGKAVPYEILEKCVNGGKLAPTAGNFQVCEFLVIDDKKIIAEMFDNVSSWFGIPRPKEGWPPGRRPKAYIVVMENLARAAEYGVTKVNCNYDVAMAAQNIQLVAHEHGIASCTVASFNRIKIKQMMNVPDNYELALLITLGYPEESPVLEIAMGGVVKRWIDEKGIRHIPKRELKEVMHRNKFA